MEEFSPLHLMAEDFPRAAESTRKKTEAARENFTNTAAIILTTFDEWSTTVNEEDFHEAFATPNTQFPATGTVELYPELAPNDDDVIRVTGVGFPQDADTTPDTHFDTTPAAYYTSESGITEIGITLGALIGDAHAYRWVVGWFDEEYDWGRSSRGVLESERLFTSDGESRASELERLENLRNEILSGIKPWDEAHSDSNSSSS